jgi:protein O-mannosyl-transferase
MANADHRSVNWQGLLPFLVAAIAIFTFLNSLYGAFVFDDFRGILNNPSLRHPYSWIEGTSRPLTVFTFRLNYATGGLKAADFHAVNVAIHIMAGLILYGIVLRTLRLPQLAGRYGTFASSVAAVVSAAWLVHPLQTESVTYISQRAELLSGLFCLLTILCVSVGVESARHRIAWFTCAVIACSLGMTAKAVMVVAPVVVFMYDSAFLAGSARAALMARWKLYLALAATWGILFALLSQPNESSNSSGLGAITVSPLEYLSAQPGIILHYLRLVFLPVSLCFDYAWSRPASLAEVALPGTLICVVMILCAWGAKHGKPAGYAGLGFFLILAPSSSIIPITDLAAEHRMYLALSVLIALLFIGAYNLLRLLALRWRLTDRAFKSVYLVLSMALIGVLSALSIERNHAYGSGELLWSDVISKRPGNVRAYLNLCAALLDKGKYGEVMSVSGKVLAKLDKFSLIQARDVPETTASAEDADLFVGARYYAHANNYRGVALAKTGKYAEAKKCFGEALRIMPSFSTAAANLKNAEADGNSQKDGGR